MQYPERPTSEKDATFRVAYIGNKPTFNFKNYDVLIFFVHIGKKKKKNPFKKNQLYNCLFKVFEK